ncbi:glycosyltransferase family 2 protein [Sphingobium sp. B11D3D]|uniref:glycosyltransferase family 2 protein n=1 Tax=Sphingobium sp. B11D3D TaxID=2940576 RepID=UPI002223FB6F|nr:glycosyltransferase [Sphingobium sp. B11D3D]MCW2368496.1 cellulose synthase/poly-beta-1,6-N-acetylglucosamine synthase-like glycosyltransferase [Sphingobium sp. B11D3D]
MMILDSLAWLIIAIPVLLLAVLAVELALGLIAGRPARPRIAAPHSAIILMPAHNEAAGIARTIALLQPALDVHIRLIVIADNCTDDTAAAAGAAGAQVIERNDPSQRGKGHALAFGRDWIKAATDTARPDCIVVLDADCEIDGASLRALIDTTCASQRPVQSCYLLRSAADDGAMTQISNFAMLIKNRVRQRGASVLGSPAILGGTGMAFPWALIESAPLATSHLVEDLVLGLHFARAGAAPRYLEAATTWSDPASQSDTLTQRARWEHGYIQTALQQGAPVMLEGIAKAKPSLAWFGLSLLVPPLALLMSLSLMALVVSAGLALLGATTAAPATLAGLLTLVALLLALAWMRDGRDTVSAATLARIPLYILWKVPVYLRLVKKRETEWVRTRRKGE